MITEVDKSYAAGVIDSDGCLHASKRTRRGVSGYVSVSMTNEKIPRWFQENWGGAFHDEGIRKDHPNWKSKKTWRLCQRAAEGFLVDIQPFLKLKGEQCRMLRLLRYFKGSNGSRVIPALNEIRLKILNRLSELNRRGLPATPNPKGT